jgi:hypothetical protein
VSVVAVLVLTHVSAVLIGAVLGYVLNRPPRRISSIDLGGDGATHTGRGRHRYR